MQILEGDFRVNLVFVTSWKQ